MRDQSPINKLMKNQMSKYILIVYREYKRKATPLGSCGGHPGIYQHYLHN